MNLVYIYNQIKKGNHINLLFELEKEIELQNSLNTQNPIDDIQKKAIERITNKIFKPKKVYRTDTYRVYPLNGCSYFVDGVYGLKYNWEFRVENNQLKYSKEIMKYETAFKDSDLIEVEIDISKIKTRAKLSTANNLKHVKFNDAYFNPKLITEIFNLMVNPVTKAKIAKNNECSMLFLYNKDVTALVLPIRLDDKSKEEYKKLYPEEFGT